MEAIKINEALKKSGKVVIQGWVHDTRDLSKVRFVIVKDGSGRIQVTGVKNKTKDDIFELMKGITKESAVIIEGELKKSDKAPGGKELLPTKIDVVGVAEPNLPIDVSDFSKTELPKRLDNRSLDLHRRKVQAIFRIQSTISMVFRNHFVKKGFTEIQTPSIISSSSEGGTDLYPVKYFEKSAYLAQSPQLYKQMVACAMGNIVTICPVWRAEKHNTTRHLNESRQMDIEMVFTDQMAVMKQLEEVVQDIVKTVMKENKEDLEILDLKLKVPKGVYLSYTEAIKKVGGKFGDDFSPEQEKKLCNLYKGDIVFTHSWPREIKPFYIMPQGEDDKAKLSEGFDALYNGTEISSGGQRIHLPDLLIKMLKQKGLNPRGFKSYIDSFRYGAPPHGGWSIGLERMTQTLLGLDNIREGVLFPRDRERLVP